MTEQSNPPLSEVPVADPALKSCRECPWRRENLNTTNEACTPGERKFSTEMMAMEWKDTAEGGLAFRCHLTTPDYYPHDEERASEGLGKPSLFKGEAHRPCAGNLQVIANELEKIKAADSHADYLRENPAGLTEASASRFKALKAADSGMRWPAPSDDVWDPSEVVDPRSTAWRLGRRGVADMQNTTEVLDPAQAKCDCTFCTEHETVHEAVTVTLANGTTARVDRRIALVVMAFAAAGVNTSASCEDIGPAMLKLDKLSYMFARDHPLSTVNYQTPIREGGAFVRFARTGLGEVIAEQLARYFTVDRHEMVAQVTFPLSEVEKAAFIIRFVAAQVKG